VFVTSQDVQAAGRGEIDWEPAFGFSGSRVPVHYEQTVRSGGGSGCGLPVHHEQTFRGSDGGDSAAAPRQAATDDLPAWLLDEGAEAVFAAASGGGGGDGGASGGHGGGGGSGRSLHSSTFQLNLSRF
jgi:hypothetical protein